MIAELRDLRQAAQRVRHTDHLLGRRATKLAE
jgi:hypothetical protein